MPSIGSYTRQIPTGLAFYNAAASSAANFYELVPTDLYNPNYAGLMQVVPDATLLNIYLASGAVLRDMGKTVKAGLVGSATTLNFYRQFQVLRPAGAAAFGVQGDAGNPDSYAPWVTVYLPVPITGAGAVSAITTSPIAGGQL